MADSLKVYEIEDINTGKVYKIEGPADAAPEEVYAFLEESLSAPQPQEAPQEVVQQPSAPAPQPTPQAVAPVPNPEPAPRQEIESVTVNAPLNDADPRFLGDYEQAYIQMASNPDVPWENVNNWVKEQAAKSGVPVQDIMVGQADLAEFRRQRAANPDAPVSGVTYTDWKESLPAPGPTVSEKDGFFSQVLRATQQAGQEMGLGLISRSLNDWMDTGGDIIDAKFPDATPEEREQLQEEYVNWLQRGVRAANEAAVAEDDLVPWLLGQVITPDPVDLIPFGKAARGATAGARIARKVGEGAAVNAAADAAYQGADIVAGVEDEFDPLQVATSAAFGGALHGGVQGVGEVAGRRATSAPTVTPDEAIAIPTAKKGSKAYKQELGTVQDGVVNYVNTITEGWTNAPKVTVHDRFTKLKDVDNDAIGVYNSQTGEVRINTEAAVREAQRLETSVEDIINAAVFHESLGHYGLAQKFGDDLDTELAVMLDNADSGLRRRVDNWLAKNPDAYEGAPNRDILALEEVLAEASEKGPIVRSLYDTVANTVKNFGRQMGLDLNFSYREVRAILAQAHGKVVRGEARDVGGSGYKYMRPKRADNLTPLRASELSADELFEAQNAYDVLERMTEGYEPTVIAMDDLRAEAEARGLTTSDLMKRKEVSPGDWSRRLMMYDIAMEKLEGKLTNLYAKIQGGEATAANRAEYARTLFRFQELSERIFGQQSEAGRALRAVQELTYTKRRVEGLKSTLEGLGESGFEELAQDPDFFNKFAMEIQDQLAEKKSTQMGPVARAWANAINLPRAIMSSADLSAPLRQGIFFIGRKEFWRAFPQMFKYAMSPTSYNDLMRDITNRPTYDLMVRSGLPFSKADGKLSQREEDFMSEWAGKIPVMGQIVKASERGYTGFLNKLRADVFDDILKKYETAGIDISSDRDTLKALGKFIGNATGRGDLGKWNSAVPAFNTIFFSPRLIASRVNLLNPAYYATLPAPIRKEAIKSLLSFGAIAMTTLSLAAMAGADVETDPRSSDFGKIKVGNTRYDALGGFTQYLTFGARLATGERKTSSGEIAEYGSDFGQKTRFGASIDFLRNKTSPVTSLVIDYLDGKDAVGEDFDPKKAMLSRLVPMYTQDIAEAMEEYGPGLGLAVSAPGLFGVSTSTYIPKPLDPDAEVKAPDSFSLDEEEITLTDEEKEQWQTRLNEYVQFWMAEEMAKPEWETLTDKERAEVISDVRSDARSATKEDMLAQMGLD